MQMTKTIHGWDVITKWDDPRLMVFKVPGADRRLTLRADVGKYLAEFAGEYHAKVMPIDKGRLDDWSYTTPRPGRASSRISDHSGGVAIDLNAIGEGRQGRRLSWFLAHPVKYANLRRLLRKYKLLEWGGDYKTFVDPMHFTFKYGVNAATVKAEMRRLGIK